MKTENSSRAGLLLLAPILLAGIAGSRFRLRHPYLTSEPPKQAINSLEWSFGNGTENNRHYGWPSPVSGKIICRHATILPLTAIHSRLEEARKGQRTNQKYRNLVGSDQQMQKLENKLNLEKLTVRLGLTTIISFFQYFVRHGLTSSGYVYSLEKTLQFKQPRQNPIVLQLNVDRCNKLINDKITKRE